MQNEISHGRSTLRNRSVNASIRGRFGFGTDVPWHSGGPTIALRDDHSKRAEETSCCICWRGCVCLIRQCPCLRFRLSPHIQNHNLTDSKIDAFLMKIATVILLQLCSISGFRCDSSFPIALDFWRFIFWVQYKTFFQFSIYLFSCLLQRVFFYIVRFLDSPAIPLFPWPLYGDFRRFLFWVRLKGFFQC